MNYYVISPNVYNNGEDYYLSDMKDRHIAIMGYSKGDGKYANMFSQMEINDRVIIARGANRNKRIHYAGIVASSSMPYQPNGESQYVELYNFKEINLYKIPFTEGNTYGASNRIPSIYRLKKGVDDNIIDAVEQILSINSFNIRDIEFWARYPNRYISNSAHYKEVLLRVMHVKESLWIGTNDII